MYQTIYYILMTLFIFVSLFMILLVLIQKGRGGGLSSAFTGGGGNTAFGSKTGDVLTWVTSVTFGVFVLLAIAMNIMVVKWPRQTVVNNSGNAGLPVETVATPDSATSQPSTLPVEIPAAPTTLPN